ncbi:hypothetical protein [Acetilactobacillus jinshanensis]|uniref:Cell division protein FtsL n=1 Tax=Acetilactobacillus jinshanensis TaxID=1720083 RepID=A0A4P6ZJT8_9LACO|nr:hypothetical protein [Acetilactobacillus jinshanensis]QBP17894.1 hypothetical protein ELX58_01735 [Acetilactobacillus jinshanensis]URL60756.1 hypothetical protein HGK75_01765 [uncultured bacterium]
MLQGNVAPKYKQVPKYRHNKQASHTNLNLKLIRSNKRRHLKGEHARLLLNNLEKYALVIGVIVALGLMVVLVSTKLTNDVYQYQIVNVDAKVSKFHNLNNNSRQLVSDLQSNDRLQKIAHHNRLSFSSHDVRNVK